MSKTWKPIAEKITQEYTTTGLDKTGTTYTEIRAIIGGITIDGGAGTTFEDAVNNFITRVGGSIHPYFSAIDWSSNEYSSGGTDYIQFIATGKVSGVPFDCDIYYYNSGTLAWDSIVWWTAIDADGPNFYDNTLNWAEGSLPTTGDQIFIGNTNEGICWGMDGSIALVDEIFIYKSFTGNFGINPYWFTTAADGSAGDTSIADYREHLPPIKTDDEWYIGQGAGNGSPLLNLRCSGSSADVYVYGTAPRSRSDRWRAVNIDTMTGILQVTDCPGGITVIDGTLSNVNCTSANGRGEIYLDAGTTLTAGDVENYGCKLTVEEATNYDFVNYGGTLTILGTGEVSSLIMWGGRAYVDNDSPTQEISGLLIHGGILDLSHRVDDCDIDDAYFYAATEDYSIVTPYRGCFNPTTTHIKGPLEWVFN